MVKNNKITPLNAQQMANDYKNTMRHLFKQEFCKVWLTVSRRINERLSSAKWQRVINFDYTRSVSDAHYRAGGRSRTSSSSSRRETDNPSANTLIILLHPADYASQAFWGLCSPISRLLNFLLLDDVPVPPAYHPATVSLDQLMNMDRRIIHSITLP